MAQAWLRVLLTRGEGQHSAGPPHVLILETSPSAVGGEGLPDLPDGGEGEEGGAKLNVSPPVKRPSAPT